MQLVSGHVGCQKGWNNWICGLRTQAWEPIHMEGDEMGVLGSSISAAESGGDPRAHESGHPSSEALKQ